MKNLLVLILFFPVVSLSQTIKFRTYVIGEEYQYKLTTEAYRNGEFSSKAIAVSSHKVDEDNGIPGEEIRWISKTLFTPADTLTFDTLAQKIKPYRISLSPEGEVLLPELSGSEMVGEITDLNTFFVAVSPALQAQKLSPKTQQISSQKLLQGNFADSIEILFGQRLIRTNDAYSVIETTFSPPATFCLKPLLDTIAAKTFDEYNNFQMIRKSEGGKVNVLWGVENFKITTTISNANGQIIKALMNNELFLRMRYNATKDLDSYVAEMPVTISRTLKLELLD